MIDVAKSTPVRSGSTGKAVRAADSEPYRLMAKSHASDVTSTIPSTRKPTIENRVSLSSISRSEGYSTEATQDENGANLRWSIDRVDHSESSLVIRVLTMVTFTPASLRCNDTS